MVPWSEFQALKSSVGQLTQCVEDLQSNMEAALSMLSQISVKQSMPGLTARIEDEAVRAQYERVVDRIKLLRKNASGATDSDEILIETVGLSKAPKVVAPSDAILATNSAGMLAGTPKKDVPHRSTVAHARLDGGGSASTPSLWPAHSPSTAGLPRTPCLPGSVPHPRCPMSPPVFHRPSSPMPGAMEPLIRVAPPRDIFDPVPQTSPPIYHRSLSPAVGGVEPLTRIAPPRDREIPGLDIASPKPQRGYQRSPVKEAVESIQQASWARSYSKESLEAGPNQWLSQSPSKEQLDTTPQRSPFSVRGEVMRVPPMMSHRGLVSTVVQELNASPRSGAGPGHSLAQWMGPTSRGTPMGPDCGGA